MDFSYSQEQEAVRELADRIFGERSTHERLKQVEAEAGPGGPMDRALWSELAGAGLVGIGVPEVLGGGGLDFIAECLVIEAAGRTAAYVPAVETMVLGAGTIQRFGTAEQQDRWLPAACSGERLLTAALAELAGDVVVPPLAAPLTTATRKAPGTWILEGTKACVPAGMVADHVLVPASLRDGAAEPARVGAFVVDAELLDRRWGDGQDTRRRVGQEATTGRVEAVLELDGLELTDAALLGGPAADGGKMLADVVERGTAALCVLQAGVCSAALGLTGDYTKSREQFGKPIATFQAVGQRAADAYVDTEAVRLTAWQAAWRVARGLPSTAALCSAKYWAAEGGQRVVHAAVHLHGGVGVDRDYPLHRLFLLTEQVELTLGSGVQSLQRLGELLAGEPTEPADVAG